MEENKNSTNGHTQDNQLNNLDIFGGAKRSDEPIQTNTINSNDSLSKNEDNQELQVNTTTNINSSNSISEENQSTNLVENITTNNNTQEELNSESKNDISKTNEEPITTTQENKSEEAEPKYEEVEIKKEKKVLRRDSYFDGKLLELFGWIFLKNFITIFTLGVMSP